ncbi:hypothetical protein [Cedecea neteri]|nr:hypothetical protein [Cedecea neteri]
MSEQKLDRAGALSLDPRGNVGGKPAWPRAKAFSFIECNMMS